MSIVEGSLEITISRDKLLASIDRSDGARHEFTIETLADQICKAFCAPRNLAPTGGLQSEIHRRQHVELSRSIIEA